LSVNSPDLFLDLFFYFARARRGVYDISLMNNEDRPTTDLPGCKWS